MPEKTYLGYGVYADFDGHHIVLTTEDGIETTNTIFLDSEIYGALQAFETRLRLEMTKEKPDATNTRK